MDVIRNIFKIKSDDSPRRIGYLDFARGILILSVLYHHSAAPLGLYVLQFHMPALFILLGYSEFLLNKKKTIWEYVKTKFFRLVVPYFCFETVNFILFMLLKYPSNEVDFSFGDALISIITCINNSYPGLYGRLWFFPAIFVASILSYFIKLISKNKTYIISMFCVLMFAVSYISSAIIPYRLPFATDIAFLGTAFLLLGHIFGNAIKYIFESKKHWFVLLWFAFFGALFILCNKLANPICHMYVNQYADFPFMVICAISGTALAFIVSKYFYLLSGKIAFFKNFVFWYSINSSAVFPVHLTIKVLSIPLLASIQFKNWVSILAIMLIFTIPFVNIITNYLPFMLGTITRKNAKNQH